MGRASEGDAGGADDLEREAPPTPGPVLSRRAIAAMLLVVVLGLALPDGSLSGTAGIEADPSGIDPGAPALDPGLRTSPTATPAVSNSRYLRRTFLARLNYERARADRPPVEGSPRLVTGASDRAQRIAAGAITTASEPIVPRTAGTAAGPCEAGSEVHVVDARVRVRRPVPDPAGPGTVVIGSSKDLAVHLFNRWFADGSPTRRLLLSSETAAVGLGIWVGSDGRVYASLLIC